MREEIRRGSPWNEKPSSQSKSPATEFVEGWKQEPKALPEAKPEAKPDDESFTEYAKRVGKQKKAEEKEAKRKENAFLESKSPDETFWQYAGRKGKGDINATKKALSNLVGRGKKK